jgi:hypothetical protein
MPFAAFLLRPFRSFAMTRQMPRVVDRFMTENTL